MVIYKYPFDITRDSIHEIVMPAYSKVLSVQNQGTSHVPEMVLYAEVNPYNEAYGIREVRTLVCVPTGESDTNVSADDYQYLATELLNDKSFVLHFFISQPRRLL